MIDASRIIKASIGEVKSLKTDVRFGLRFKRLKVIKFAGFYPKGRWNAPAWKCICDCGNETIVLEFMLKRGLTKSCGCWRRIFMKQKKGMKIHTNSRIAVTKHNESRGRNQTPEYRTWRSMKIRCLYKSTAGYERYGGRGIKICARWLNSFENFLADMGRKPTIRHTIGRIKNDGNYNPGNCKWVTRKEQQSNTSISRIIHYKGKSKTITQWARDFGISKNTLFYRFNSGWSASDCFKNPLK